MDEFSQRYEKILFERDYPPPPLDMDATVMEAAGAAGKKPEKAAEQKPMTAADVALTTMDTINGLLRGAATAIPGMPGDIESLILLLTGHQRKFPTTADIQAFLPPLMPEGKQIDPRRRATSESSTTAGEFLPVAPIAVLKDVAKAVRKGAKK